MLWKLLSRRIPALFTTMSMRPKASSALCTIAAPPSGVATELVSSTASPPASLISSTTCWPGPGATTGAVDGAAEVVDDDQRAPARQEQGVLPPEAAARTGDDRHLAVESEVRHRHSTLRPP